MQTTNSCIRKCKINLAVATRRRDGEIAMKKFLLGTVGLLALGMGAPASAADMAVKARPPAPVLAPIYDWTGFYIGGNGGWGQTRNCWDFLDVTGFAVAERVPRAVRGPHRRPDRLSLASQSVGVWRGSPGRLGGFQQPARQPVRSGVLHSHQNRWHRPLYRPDRLRLERSAILRKGRRGGDEQPL